jgi:hypothetical protein
MAESGEVDIVLIDNERSFGLMFTKPTADGMSTRAHCALFCFYEMLAQPVHDCVYEEIMASKRGIFEAGAQILKENSYQSELYVKVNDGDREKTILGIPIDADAIKAMSLRFNEFVGLMSSDRSRSLAAIFAGVSSELASIYKFDEAASTPATTPVLVAVRERLHQIDTGRSSGPTPRSAYAPLKSYFGSTEHNQGVLLEVLMWTREHCGTLDFVERAGIELMIARLQGSLVR